MWAACRARPCRLFRVFPLLRVPFCGWAGMIMGGLRQLHPRRSVRVSELHVVCCVVVVVLGTEASAWEVSEAGWHLL